MPWLTGTALLHSALVVERRQTLVNWTILLGILTFSLSLIGTFLVRSGRADQRAFLRARSGARHLRARPDRADLRRRARALRLSRTGPEGRHALCRRSAANRASCSTMSLLVSAGATVFLGTFYPLVIEATSNDKISVGPPFYNLTFVPMMIPLLIVMAVGPMLKWKRDTIRDALAKLMRPAIVAGLVRGRGARRHFRRPCAGGVRLRAGALGDRRIAGHSRPARALLAGAVRYQPASGANHAALGLWAGPRPCGHRHRRRRDHRHVHLETGGASIAAQSAASSMSAAIM